MRTFKIYSVSKFQVYSIVLLTIVPMLYIRSPELIHLITGSLYPLTHLPIFPPLALETAILLSGSLSLPTCLHPPHSLCSLLPQAGCSRWFRVRHVYLEHFKKLWRRSCVAFFNLVRATPFELIPVRV